MYFGQILLYFYRFYDKMHYQNEGIVMRKLIVGGTFDENEGKSSYIVSELIKSLGKDWDYINGGNISYIQNFSPEGIDVLLWMPNISNDEAKIIGDLKVKNPRMILIQSKRVIEKEYLPSDVVGRLLKSHALLGIMITKEVNQYRYRLLDPLGNQWTDSSNIADIGVAINSRLDYLLGLSRIGSIKKEIESQYIVPSEFIDIIKEYGSNFTKFVNAVNPNRLLGNASTRCAKGFPAIRMENHILVTKRNVDKQTLNEDDFVLVEQDVNKSVYYKGENKPSVDTPIQLKLFKYYPNVKFMIHGHAYVKDGLFTSHKVPCGYMEEFDEIKGLIPNTDATNFKINLRGHGCLILANDLNYLKEQIVKLYSRPFPEQ